MYTPKRILVLKSLFSYKQSWSHLRLVQSQHNNNNILRVVVEFSVVINAGTEVGTEGEETEEEGEVDPLNNPVRLILMT